MIDEQVVVVSEVKMAPVMSQAVCSGLLVARKYETELLADKSALLTLNLHLHFIVKIQFQNKIVRMLDDFVW